MIHSLTSRLKTILIFVLVLVVILGLSRLVMLRLDALQNVPEQEHVGLPVDTVEVITGSIADTVTYSGTVRAATEAVLAPKIMAGIESVHCSEGDRVTSGQVLVTLDDGELQKKVNTLKRRVDSAKINFEYWEEEVNTYKTLLEQGAIPRHEYENITFKRDAAAAALKEAGAALEEAREALNNTTLKSPLSGVVTAVTMEEGEMGTPGKPVLTVANGDSLKVFTHVVEGDLVRMENQAKAIVKFPGNTGEVVSRVDKIYPALNANTRTAVVEIPVPPEAAETAGLQPGMSADVSIVLAQKEQALLVPVNSIKEQGEEDFVFVVKGKRAVKKKVETGIVGERQAEIITGVSAGDRVVLNPPAELYDGREVYVLKEETRL